MRRFSVILVALLVAFFTATLPTNASAVQATTPASASTTATPSRVQQTQGVPKTVWQRVPRNIGYNISSSNAPVSFATAYPVKGKSGMSLNFYLFWFKMNHRPGYQPWKVVLPGGNTGLNEPKAIAAPVIRGMKCMTWVRFWVGNFGGQWVYVKPGTLTPFPTLCLRGDRISGYALTQCTRNVHRNIPFTQGKATNPAHLGVSPRHFGLAS